MVSKNYRSTPQIVETASCLIESSGVEAVRGSGAIPSIANYSDEETEARGIAEKINEIHFSGEKWSNQAVLVRTNAQTGIFATVLHEAGIPVKTVSGSGLLERKDIFMQRSDAFIVLPGGVGSLDELAEVMASNQLGIINKPIGILNTNGYYNDLLSWMKKAVEEGFISEANFKELIITESCDELIDRIISEERPADDDWTNRLGL